MNIERIRKAVAAAIGLSVPVIAAFSTAISDGKWDEQEVGVFVSAVLALVGGTYAVWRVPNEPAPQPEPEVPGFVTGQYDGPPRHF